MVDDAPLSYLADQLPSLVAAIPTQVLRERRWFAGKARPIAEVSLFDHASLATQPPTLLALIQVRYADGGREVYQLPLAFLDADRPTRSRQFPMPLVRLPSGLQTLAMCDAFEDAGYALLLLRLIREQAARSTAGGTIRFQALDFGADLPAAEKVRISGAEQSNTSVVYDGRWILKSYRRIELGINRDFEVGQFFRQHTGFDRTPLPLGQVEYLPADGPPTTLAVLHPFVQNEGDGWSYLVGRLAALYRALLEQPQAEKSESGLRHRIRDRAAGVLGDLELLGSTTARMHVALAAPSDAPDFAPQPVRPVDLQIWTREAEEEVSGAVALLRSQAAGYAPPLRSQVEQFLSRGAEFLALVRELAAGSRDVPSKKIQVHGDYHLGQVLKTADGFVVIDFEGEVSHPLEQRRARQSPLRDVAGMLRSFDYAASAAARETASHVGAREVGEYARAWEREASHRFLAAYCQGVAGGGLLPEEAAEIARLVRFFQLSKAFYELKYELNNRPDWVSIPLGGIERLVQQRIED